MKLTEEGRSDALLSFVLREFELHLFEKMHEDKPVEMEKEDGYEPMVINPKDWKLSKDGKIARADKKDFEFPRPMKKKIAGFYLTRPDEKPVLYLERFSDGPYDILRSGESVGVTVVLEK